jgi:hypothetical protein
MSAVATSDSAPSANDPANGANDAGSMATGAAPGANDSSPNKQHAGTIADHFRSYNDEFGRITRRAALNFLAEDWQSAQTDAVARIELYDDRVTRCVTLIAAQLGARRKDVTLWAEIKRAYEMLVARRPDSDFYRTFFNSVSRDLFGTVGVNPEVEFCATNVGRASGAVPMRVYRTGGSLPDGRARNLADLPFGAAINDRTRRCIASAPKSAAISNRPASGRPNPSNSSNRCSTAACTPSPSAADRRRLHHAAGDCLHQLQARRSSRRGHAVARRRGLAVRYTPDRTSTSTCRW